MHRIVAGCEYSGASTLAAAINEWGGEAMGGGFDPNLIHDHYSFPHTSGHGHEMTAKEQTQMLGLAPTLKEMVQRHNLYYHVKERNYDRLDHIVVGLHIEDTVWGAMYFGYGEAGTGGDRGLVNPDVENMIMKYGPETILLLVTASRETIARRMKESPHPNGILRKEDIDVALQQFAKGFAASRIPKKLTIDTTDRTVQESVEEFARTVTPLLTDTDRRRLREEGAV
jgi:hypothetical protein